MVSAESKTMVKTSGSVRVKLALFVAALMIATTILMSSVGYFVAREIIEDQIHERLRVAASDRHAMVLAFVAQQHERASLVASRTRLRNLVDQFASGAIPESEMRSATRPILLDALAGTQGFLTIWITDPKGVVLTSTDDDRVGLDLSDNPVFRAGLTSSHLSEPISGRTSHVAVLACPARTNENRLLGVVMVELDVTRLHDILAGTDGLGKTGQVLIGRREGEQVHYLFGPRSGLDRNVALSKVPAMAAAIGGANASEITHYNGTEALVHYRPIEFQPLEYQAWGLVATIDVEEAYAPLDQFFRARLWLQAGLLLIGLLGSFWLARRLTRPIRELTETATAVAGGDLSAQVSVSTNDEIGMLGRTFNTMTRKLQTSYSTLEERVRQRTAELSNEIARREEIQEELQRNAARIKRIIDTANDAFVSMDALGCVVEWNPQAEAMFGWARDEIIGLKVADTVIPEAFREQHNRGLERFLKTREARVLNTRLELTALRRDGREFPVELTITPQRLGDEFVFNAFLHDITQRKADEQALHEARESAEAANRAKSEFLANMSHEIRTPMNGIIGMSELLSATKLEPEQQDYLKMMQHSAESLLRLLNDILDFSKIEAGKLELERIPFSLRDCIGKAGHTLAPRAAEKNIELVCRVAPEISDVLIGDPGRLGQAVMNLAANAIKFTDQGEVVIDVAPMSTWSATADAGDNEDNSNLESQEFTTLSFSVRDTGIGIPPEKQKVIFDAFGQADSSTTRQYGGTGLGLAIATQLVAMMSGEIQVESEVGKGTTFSFTAEFGVSKQGSLRKPSELSTVSGLTVLIVDDNETNRHILREMTLIWNMRPLMADSTESGLALIQQMKANDEPAPKLILLDYMMPRMDGFEFARQLRETVSDEESTIIMVSSAVHPSHADLCRELKIARCLPKPVMQSDLLNAILSEMGSESLLLEESAKPQDDDVAPRRILLAEDGVVNQRVAIGLLQKRGHQVVAVKDGQEAVDAVARERFDLILMDVQMPRMDGFAATAAIRKSQGEDGTYIPIIAMTANAMKGDREKCLESGMDDYVAKPLNSTALYRAVESITARVLKDEGSE